MKRIRSARRRGFTLLELMVVITIIGLLSAVVVVSTRGLPAKGRRTKLDHFRCRTQVRHDEQGDGLRRGDKAEQDY